MFPGPYAQGSDGARDAVMRELRSAFRPEFLNRVDDVVLFTPLRMEDIKRIVGLLVDSVRRRLADRGIRLELAGPTTDFLARRGYDPVYGARPLKRFLQRELETRLARELIRGAISDGSTVHVGLDGEALTIRAAPPPVRCL